MPLTAKGHEILANMQKEYGEEKGKQVFYASRNAGKVVGVDTFDGDAAGVLLTHGNRALFLKRSPKAKDHQGEWCCPGGSIEGGETPEQAAKRETQEETGYSTGDITQIDDYAGFVTFRANVDNEFAPARDDESTEHVWAPIDDPPQPLHPGVSATLKKLLTNGADAAFSEGDHPRGKSTPASTGGSFVAYHGTHTGALASIREKGLSPTGHGRNFRPEAGDPPEYLGERGNSVYFSEERGMAQGWAGRVVRENNKPGNPAVLEIHVPESERSKIKEDELRPEGGHYRFTGHIPPEWIKGVQVQEPSGKWVSKDDANVAQDRREYDTNGWFEVLDNPLSKVGVFPYSEASLVSGGDPRKMINVYRPAEELGSPETVASFRLMPWIDDHPATLLGSTDKGLMPAEAKGVEGVIGEKTYFSGDTLYGNIKVFSEALAKKLAGGKRELSLGYHCDFVKEDGVYQGTPYQYVQRNLRGNHGASVKYGRMGSEVRVLDAAETLSLSFALDLREHEQTTITSPEDPTMPVKAVTDVDPAKRALDAMNEEEAADKAEEAKDAAEEKEDGEKEDKDAKDRRRARDKRAGARDERKRARDKAHKEAKDAADAAAAKTAKDAADAAAATAAAAAAAAAAGKGMDAAAVTALVKEQVSAATTALIPGIRKEEASKHKLYERLSPLVGAFDHAEMSHVEMATYGLGKLGVTTKPADPVEALDMLLTGREQAAEALQGARQRTALDGTGAGTSFLDKYLTQAAA